MAGSGTNLNRPPAARSSLPMNLPMTGSPAYGRAMCRVRRISRLRASFLAPNGVHVPDAAAGLLNSRGIAVS